MFKRISLFLITNLLVIFTLSLIAGIFGINRYFSTRGIDYPALILFCGLWGMGGAFISLMLSRWIAKMSMGVQVIDPETSNSRELNLLKLVYSLAHKAGLSSMPWVGIYPSTEFNAFATGPSRSKSLVAVSSGLLQGMDPLEIEGVLAHEISHIVNGDMVTMTLLQGVINAFSLFLSRIVAFALTFGSSRDEDKSSSRGSWFQYQLIVFVLDMLFTFLGSLVVAAFSRYREFRADYGGAQLVGFSKMVAALTKLRSTLHLENNQGSSFSAFKISHYKMTTLFALLATHPSLDARISRLQKRSI